MKQLLLIVLWFALAGIAVARPMPYALDAAQSVVGFDVGFGEDRITGTMGVRDADIAIDFNRLENSRIDVSIDVAAARASFPFATQAMLGPKVLAAAEHPTINFVSRTVRPTADGARIEGDITIRGVTRPIALDAGLYRQQGAAPDDLSELWIRLSGTLSRRAFGATGWDNMVGDEVGLRILARMVRASAVP
jgi:polyisoprenoid-binding protein YceI